MYRFRKETLLFINLGITKLHIVKGTNIDYKQRYKTFEKFHFFSIYIFGLQLLVYNHDLTHKIQSNLGVIWRIFYFFGIGLIGLLKPNRLKNIFDPKLTALLEVVYEFHSLFILKIICYISLEKHNNSNIHTFSTELIKYLH